MIINSVAHYWAINFFFLSEKLKFIMFCDPGGRGGYKAPAALSVLAFLFFSFLFFSEHAAPLRVLER